MCVFIFQHLQKLVFFRKEDFRLGKVNEHQGKINTKV